jgi:hypothetical protein
MHYINSIHLGYRHRTESDHSRLFGVVVVTGVVVGSLGWWAFRRGVAPRHAAVNHKVCTVDEAALVAGQEENTLSLLDSLSEATSWEVNFAAVTLGLVVAKPVLEEGSAVMVSFTCSRTEWLLRTSMVPGKAR